MATVYKRTRRKPIPEGADIVEQKGRRSAVWTDSAGRHRARLSDDGSAILIDRPGYVIQYFDENGERRKESVRCGDADTARQVAAEREKAVLLRKKGIIDPAQERTAEEGRRPLAVHLADYEAKLRTAGRDGRYVADTMAMLRAALRDGSATMTGEISADAVNRFAAGLKERGLSARRIHAHLTALKGFTRWLTMRGKLPTDPLASVKKPSPKTDRRRERRILLPEEWEWLRSVTLSEAVDWRGIPAAERVALYATAIQTGLRQSELRSLTRGRLFLEGAQSYVTCKAGSTKNRKDCRQYIQPDLAAELRSLVATKAPAAPVFTMPDRQHTAGMLRADLATARREWLKAVEHDPQEHARRLESDFLIPVNHEGETLDFHSLRHTCGAWLAMAGASPKAVQAVMRHSSITLTMDTYGHLFPGEEAATIARLPSMLTDAPEAARATGTADGRAELAPGDYDSWGQKWGQLNGTPRPKLANRGENHTELTDEEDKAQPVTLSLDEKGRRVLATSGQRVAEGTRTPNSQIHSLVL